MPEQKTNYNLAGHYAKASLLILVVLTFFLGLWINHTIREQVIENTALNAALYAQSFISPELQALNNRNRLTETEIDHFKHLLRDTPLGRKIRSLKIWTPNGKLLFHPQESMIGEQFEPTESLLKAASGSVAAEFDDADPGKEDFQEAQLDVKLLEIYTPVKHQDSDEIIAIAEFYHESDTLAEHLDETRKTAWLIVFATMLLAYGLLFIIVWRGNKTIQTQGIAIKEKLLQLKSLLENNKSLSQQLRRSLNSNTETNERLLTRLSADLHDGPAQHLGFALLRLDTLGNSDKHASSVIINELKSALQDSLTELRNISKGLALPKLADMSAADIATAAVKSHQSRTGSNVDLTINLDAAVPDLQLPVKIALFRSIQEGLNNAYRHAEGQGQKVFLYSDSAQLTVSISDSGPGFDPDNDMNNPDRLGLNGLRERIYGLDGQFSIKSKIGEGTQLEVCFPLKERN